MSVTKQVTLWCDRDICRRHVQLDVSVVSEARALARGEGWRYFGGEDRCPTHRGAK